jgi:hypothetical protein
VICYSCHYAGKFNAMGEDLLAEEAHELCKGGTWCDCAHKTGPWLKLPPECPNCDGRKCMDCVLRYWHEECVDDCPECCADQTMPVPVGSGLLVSNGESMRLSADA